MGIKGIYKEIGPGDRVSLAKLAVETLEQTGRPLRLAIDFSIWQFQVQAGKGGTNPAIRTLFYRLLRLLSLAIHPIFVFDGPNKPTFKRNKRTSKRNADEVGSSMAKRLIRLFGFTSHNAPGEAEAECALLQQQDIVDAVLSEDVDTLMFGCRKTLRNWSSEGPRGGNTPTHVSMYDTSAVAAGASGLDREGMVLVALMSGGDYLPEGIPGCGPKVACEAAKAGFGRDLCQLKRSDKDGLAAWKERLLHELRTNESRFFRTKHMALEIPQTFPNMEVLGYYTHPVVSREETVDRLKKAFPPTTAVDVVGLREFTLETFDWAFRNGAVKLVRVLAPGLLVQKLLARSGSASKYHDEPEILRKEESALVTTISSERAHFSTDGTPELRLSFIPNKIVKLDLDSEPEEVVEGFSRTGIALNSDGDDDFEEEAAVELDPEAPKTANARKPFDPSQPDLVWIPQVVAKLGLPLLVNDWEGKQQLKAQRAAVRASRKTKAKPTDMPVGALDQYVTMTKKVAGKAKKDSGSALDSPPPKIATQRAPRTKSKPDKTIPAPSQAKPSADINAWTICSQGTPRSGNNAHEPIVLSSSPIVPPSFPTRNPGLTHTTQALPTRTKQPVGDVLLPPLSGGPSPTPKKDPLPISKLGGESNSPTRAQPARKPRPFKRVKSGADDPAKHPMTQTSIKDFGRVLKESRSSKTTSKPAAAATSSQPIEIMSSDDDPFTSPPRPQPPTTLPKTVPPAPRAAKTTPDPPPRQPTPPAELDPFGDDDTPAVPAQTSSTSSTGPRKSATTKLLILRTSLGGRGYFAEVEVSRDEADEVLQGGPDAKGGKTRRRGWRLSELEVLDLTEHK
ncbi:hypothetical protein C8A05DRAFT_40732 [Staphylotrichum tortipilum]|uniref:Flap structure-specific endonuclease n=1 Tax=Staphylotrichum tortipilum TaxID=2831512 RepID=A0AAN6MT43_9PEZI|nr:hypothetical protein C8A05DRAFT_40732 [Staphylotrichum longicolle]